MNRRDVLGNGLKGLALVSMSGAVPRFLEQSAAAAPAVAGGRAGADGPVLVVIQLAGGNDGLNTVVPHADDAYYRARPNLAVAKEAVLKLNDAVGLHPSLAPLRALYDAGRVAIVQGVGYPNPDFSHFRATEIWETANPTGPAKSGWLGRFYDNYCNGLGHPAGMAALGTARVPPMLRAEGYLPPVLSDPENYQVTGGPDDEDAKEKARRLQAMRGVAEGPAPPLSLLDYIQKTAQNTHACVDEFRAVAQVKVDAEYPDTPLAKNLRLVAQMLRRKYPTRVFYVSLDGFDTHAGQAGPHDALLTTLAAAVSAFQTDLEKGGLADRVVLMTFSEFGRRVEQNASNGTDHGSAAPLFVVGARVKGGLFGTAPSLTQLNEGNLQFTSDFRSVYATLLQRWLRADAPKILGGEFPSLDLLPS